MQHSESYLSAWHTYTSAGHDFGALTASQLAALAEDVETKQFITAWQRQKQQAETAAEQQRVARTPTVAAASRKVAPLDATKALTKLVAGDDIDAWLTANKRRAAPIWLVGALLNAQREVNNALATRIAALEAQPKGLAYRGVWDSGATYTVNEAVTRSGAIWICKLHACQSVPGADGGIGWTLAVKSGKPGKDCRCPHCTEHAKGGACGIL